MFAGMSDEDVEDVVRALEKMCNTYGYRACQNYN